MLKIEKKLNKLGKVILGQEYQGSIMDYPHESPEDQRERGQEGALHLGERDHKNVKNRRKLTKLG